MGILFNDKNEIDAKMNHDFGDVENHLIALKHNDIKSGFLKLLMSNLYHTLDSNRTFIVYFSSKGLHEKEISHSVKGDFLLVPWHEIGSFELKMKNNKALIELSHLGKKIGYEIPFTGKLFAENKKNLKHLQDKGWYKVEE
ncbi:histidine kinase [Peptococcus simiae]|uniref:Histidine kinase n=1 Tax=Peptococcus simiae TaxID=1643805 RepID=A0ABW9H057_9FIRM